MAKDVSKFLSLVLRHKPETLGLVFGQDMDEFGWVDLDTLIGGFKKHGNNVTLHDIENIVKSDDKGRYQIESGRIRAVQGHSLGVFADFEKVTPPPVLYHGTADRFCNAIERDGLKPMGRTMVHLSKDVDTAANVGKRHGKLVIYEVDTKGLADVFIAKNGVFLTKYVNPSFLTRTTLDYPHFDTISKGCVNTGLESI
jgi:putative RNA 2'-phosphotransferase